MCLVSVIIPVHKTIDYLKSCVASVLTQTHQNIEIIIACNGDLNIDDCKSFLNIDDYRIVYIQTANGRHNARNEALKISKGDYIQYLDYDDMLFVNKIETQLKSLQENNSYEVCVTKWKKFKTTIDESYKFPFLYLFDDLYVSTNELIDKLGKSKGFLATSSWLVKRSCVDTIYWIDSPNDDAVFFSELFKKQVNFLMIPEVLAGYRIHDNNTSSLRSKEEFVKLFSSWKKITKNLNFYDSKLKSQYLFNAYSNLLIYSRQIKNFQFLLVFYYTILYALKGRVKFSSIFVILKNVLK